MGSQYLNEEAYLSLITLKGYWADIKGTKIDRVSFGATVRFYIEKFLAYDPKLKISLKSGKIEEIIVEDTINKLNPHYCVQREQYIEIKLKERQEYIKLQKVKEIELCCSVSNGFWRFVEQENVAKIKLCCNNYYIHVERQWECKVGEHSNQATISSFYIEGTSIKGYFLEPIGESTNKSGLDKRIPIGKYNLKWHISPKYNKSKYKDRFLENGFPKLFNESVSEVRGILIHRGNIGEHSLGCLLPGIGKADDNSKVTGSTDAFNSIIDFIEKVGIDNVKVLISENLQKK